jgi:hypothetical protein
MTQTLYAHIKKKKKKKKKKRPERLQTRVFCLEFTS